MPDQFRKLSLPALALLTAVAIPAVHAQEDRWFRVELLVFANETTTPPEGAASAEQWEATPKLAYPNASRFLIDDARVAENAAEFDGESLVDEYGRQIITILLAAGDTDATGPEPLPDPDAGQGLPEPPAGSSAEPTVTAPVPAPLSPVYEGAPPPGAAPVAVKKTLVLPRPFVLLPSEYQEFRGKAALMQRSGNYSVLFHEAWVQPVAPEDRSIPIVLDRSGDTREWSRLQGSIKLYLSRYLHAETNLWLNTAGEYLPGSWQMPAPPLGPPSLIIEEQAPVDFATAMGELAGAGNGEVTGTQATTGGAVGAGVQPEATADTAGPPDQAPEGLTPQDPNAPAVGPDGEALVEVPPPVYPYRHAVLLDQTRRMRSGEIHYIDHPLLGVIIKFTPVTAEELDAIATATDPAAGDDDQLP